MVNWGSAPNPLLKEEIMNIKNIKKHSLRNGATIISVSPHGFRFSDGTSCEAQEEAVCAKLTLKREYTPIKTVKGMPLNQTRMLLDKEQITFLRELCRAADLVIIPFPVLSALREQGIRELFPNAVAFNATKETQRDSPNEKIVDIENWSY